jgi:hypothetical protein
VVPSRYFFGSTCRLNVADVAMAAVVVVAVVAAVAAYVLHATFPLGFPTIVRACAGALTGYFHTIW